MGKATCTHLSLRMPCIDWLSPGRFLAMITTYIAALLVNFFYLKSTKMTWDYACSTSLIHLVVTCIGTVPLNTSYPLLPPLRPLPQ